MSPSEMVSAVSMASTGLPAAMRPRRGEAVRDFALGTLGNDVNGAAAIMRALEQSLGLEVGDVLVDGGERTEAKAGSDLLIRGGVAVPGGERGEKVENLFLPTRDSHGVILANKRRIGGKSLGEPEKLRAEPKWDRATASRIGIARD